MKLKVLWYSDFLCGSGFGRVAHELVRRLDATGLYEFHVLGINYHGEPANHPNSPYRALQHIPVHPAAYYPGDPRGERRLLQLLAQERFDVLFAMVNPWDLRRLGPKLQQLRVAQGFRFVYYFPIEGDCDPDWVTHAIGLADRPVAYTHFGAEQVLRASGVACDVIYHGVDARVFHRWLGRGRAEYRSRVWGASDEDLVLVNVNRNQPRKDLPRSMLVAREVAKERHRPVMLYLHAHPQDVAGFDLHEFQARWMKGSDVRVICGGQRSIPDEQLAHIYSAGDMLITTALCEGWGLSTIEAMASELPVVAPDVSVFPELLGDGSRGLLARTDGFTMLPGQTGLFELTSVKDMAGLIGNAATPEGRLELEPVTRAAKQWVLAHCDWDQIAAQWEQVFASVS